MDEVFSSSTVKQGFHFGFSFSGIQGNANFYWTISCYIHRVRGAGPNDCHSIQASRKPIFSPMKMTFLIKVSLSWSERWRANSARSTPFVRLSFSSPLSFVSTENVALAWLCLLGQTLVRCSSSQKRYKHWKEFWQIKYSYKPNRKLKGLIIKKDSIKCN